MLMEHLLLGTCVLTCGKMAGCSMRGRCTEEIEGETRCVQMGQTAQDPVCQAEVVSASPEAPQTKAYWPYFLYQFILWRITRAEHDCEAQVRTSSSHFRLKVKRTKLMAVGPKER